MSRCAGFRVWLLLLLGALSALTATAHDPGLSSLEITATVDGVQVELRLSATDAAAAVPLADLDDDRVLDQIEVEESGAALQAAGLAWVDFSASDRAIPMSRVAAVWEAEDEDVMWHTRIAQQPEGNWTVNSEQFATLPPGHRLFVTARLVSGEIVAEGLLGANNATLIVPWGERSVGVEAVETEHETTGNSGGSRLWLFFKLGVEHILIGFDHLLFLAGLLIACRGWKAMLAVITSFTVAHSITLGLAALNVVQFPAGWVEPLIAASIVYVGVENLWRGDEEPKGRWLLTFGFGLIHGFGFAGVLRELGLGSDGQTVVSALFGFNVGVEVGQAAIALLVLPLLAKARQWPSFERRGPMIVSLVVTGMGLFWLIERTLL
ncbi:HupE/UreJ family protein [Synoicihabitans lomoniglobus]|uniref:HupE/UreJ family protein n=1 Tax=Synoicihabitans lomoniglobus TaxID=2909285 RepID=A0AAE9ZZ49_9BACT|nr:HupE/UreJ family protein [Opitutaceae bacterium LMO-M01]WED63973.1 HupE/UreJ family protein [Opitutaceae bacterium LMO-M01]